MIVGATSSEDSVATEIAERLQVYAVAVVDPREEAVVTPNYTSPPERSTRAVQHAASRIQPSAA